MLHTALVISDFFLEIITRSDIVPINVQGIIVIDNEQKISNEKLAGDGRGCTKPDEKESRLIDQTTGLSK